MLRNPGQPGCYLSLCLCLCLTHIHRMYFQRTLQRTPGMGATIHPGVSEAEEPAASTPASPQLTLGCKPRIRLEVGQGGAHTSACQPTYLALQWYPELVQKRSLHQFLGSPQLGSSHQPSSLTLHKVPPQRGSRRRGRRSLQMSSSVYSIVCPPQTVRPIEQNQVPFDPSTSLFLQHSCDKHLRG